MKLNGPYPGNERSRTGLSLITEFGLKEKRVKNEATKPLKRQQNPKEDLAPKITRENP